MELAEPLHELIHQPLEFTKDLKFPPPERIKLYDDTLRDGEQMPGVAFSPEQKYKLACMLSRIGIHIIDLGFPGAAESDREALKLIVQGRRKGEIREDMELLVMCRSNRKDIDVTLEALRSIGVEPHEVTFFIFTSGSDLHLKYKLGKTLLKREGKSPDEWLKLPVSWYREANIRMSVEAIQYAREKGVQSIEFGGEDGSRADVDYLIQLAKACYEAGGTRYSFPDTVGCFTPEAVRHYMTRIVSAFPDQDLVVHFHNDYGLAAINTITAMSCGINIPTCTVNGLGERAGNAPLHQVVVTLKQLYGVEVPGFHYDMLIELRKMVEEFSGIPVAVNEPIIGEGVYTHESGIHTAGLLIHPAIYQVIPPELVGAKIRYVFGKHSGAAAVEKVLRDHEEELRAAGIEITPQLINEVTYFVKAARQKRTETDQFTHITDYFYREWDRLGISEKRLVELAMTIGEMARVREASK
jgi:isopropylmalate/homocitrate/citramalate synthase